MHDKSTSRWRNTLISCGIFLLLSAVIAFVQPQIDNAQIRLYLAVSFQCLILAALFVLCARAAYGWLREAGYTKLDILWICLWSVVMITAMLVAMYFYYRVEKDIKVYDYSQYWIQVLEYRAIIADSIPSYLQRLLSSLSYEYTALPAFALQPASYLFGTSFTGYVQSIFVMYCFPAAFLLSTFSMRLVHGNRAKAPRVYAFLACLGSCVLAPVFLIAVVQGYLDVVGVLVMAIMLNIVLRWNGWDFSVRRNLTLSLLSVLLLLLRRWYAYYIVGFYFAIGVMVLIDAIASKRNFWKQIRGMLLNLVMIALVSVVLILVLNRDVFAAFLSTDYGEAYSAYKTTSTLQDILYIIGDIGYLGTLVAAVGFGILVYHRHSRSNGLRLLISMLVAGGLFLLVQTFGVHHRDLVTPTLLIFIMVFIGFLLQNLTVKKEKVVSVALLVFCCVNMSIAFIPNTTTLGQIAWIASTGIRKYPENLKYYDVFWEIASDLDIKTGRKAASVYMLGENEIGPEYLRRINLPYETDAAPYLITNSIVDLRDGFPSQMFFADFVLVPDPLVNTLSDVQQISYQIYEMFLEDPMIAEYYELDTVYQMDSKTTLSLFRKIQSTDRALIDNLKVRLLLYYPDTPLVYQPIYFLALSSFNDSMRSYNFYTKELTFSVGPDEPTTFQIHDTGSFTEMSFALNVLSANLPGLELVVENQDGEIYRADINTADTQYQVDVAGSTSLQVSIVPQEDISEEGWILLRFADDSLR